MASLRSIVHSKFWNEQVESTASLDSVVHTLPGDPPPLAILRNSRLFRCQQLLLLQHVFSFPFTPSYCNGGLFLDRVIGSSGGRNWWATLTARVRTQGLLYPFRKENNREEDKGNGSSPSGTKPWIQVKRLLCGSLHAMGMHTRARLGPNTSFSASCEVDDAFEQLFCCNNLITNDKKPWHGLATFRHKLQQHHIVMEAAWNDKCVDSRGIYWNVPKTVSLDLVSAFSSSGFRYRVGVHHRAGVVEPISHGASAVPSSLLAGTCVQGAASVEKEVNIWKDIQQKSQKPYNLLASHPHISVLGIVGGVLTGNISGGGVQQEGLSSSMIRPAISADAFASVGLSAQLGHFQKPLLDFSKINSRLDFGAALSLAGVTSNSGIIHIRDWAFPTLEVSLQQQVAGPVRARMDNRFKVGPLTQNRFAQLHDITYGLDCSLDSLGAAKIVLWYSPIRREGMMEIRMLER